MSCKEVEQMTKELTSYIQQTLDDRTLWEQLAEEGTELSKAALKFIRATGMSNNPTPISAAQAFADVKEELQDVLHVCSILGLIDNVKVDEEKLKRWVKRIKGEGDTPKGETLAEPTEDFVLAGRYYKCSHCGYLDVEPNSYCTCCGRKVKVVKP